MTVPPQNGPNDPYGAPQGYPQQQPAYPPSQPPAYGQQGGYPQQGYGSMPPAPTDGYGQAPQKRPGVVTAAAVLAFVVGGIALLAGLAGLVAGGMAGMSGLFSLIALLIIAVGAIEVWGGLQVLKGRDARILTVAAGISIVLNLITLINSFEARSLTGFVIPGLILYFLLNAQSKAWFDRVGAKHF